MYLLRVYLLLFGVVMLAGCDSRPGGASEDEANMPAAQYDAMINAEESQRDRN